MPCWCSQRKEGNKEVVSVAEVEGIIATHCCTLSETNQGLSVWFSKTCTGVPILLIRGDLQLTQSRQGSMSTVLPKQIWKPRRGSVFVPEFGRKPYLV